MGSEMKWYHRALIGLLLFCCIGALIWSAGHNSSLLESAQSEVNGQREVIAKQAFDFNRFNQVADFTSRNNSLIAASTEKTVIEYREILRREKTCDLPVPVDISDGLLEYANSLRTRAMHSYTTRADEADNRPVTAKRLTYCQAVLWIRPLLAEADKANGRFFGIQNIEASRNGSASLAK